MTKPKKKIAVLGGGMAALTAVYQLSQYEKYDIDVYQIGWRLGGKGASGRNPEKGDRIEEHGLHVWLGFYDNAFSIMHKVYEELDRAKADPLSRMYKQDKSGIEYSDPLNAFTSVNRLNMLETTPSGERKPWHIEFPTNSLEPGLHDEAISLWDYVDLALKWIIRDLFGDLFEPEGCLKRVASFFQRNKYDAFATLPEKIVKPTDEVRRVLADRNINKVVESENREKVLWHIIYQLLNALGSDVDKHSSEDHSVLVWLLKEVMNEWWERIKDTINTNDDERRKWVLTYLATSYIAGCLESQVLYKGFNQLNDMDLREWFYTIQLVEDPLANELAIQSAPMQTLYDLAFHYEGGNTDKPRLAAGIAIEILARLALGYKGSVLYFMNAGMGDTIFAPLYQLLKRRGVKFHFFHRVTELGLSEDKKSVQTVKISRQVNLNVGEYEPLILVKDLACWPNNPIYAQIVEGEQLKKDGVNLEHAWNTWKDTGGELTLDAEKGDFDHVILGITLATLPPITQQLKENDNWKAMLGGIKTVQTQAVQIWFNRDAKALGVDELRPVVGAYVEPYSSLSDFSHLLSRENWPENGPKHLIYDCGVMDDLPDETQPKANKRVRKNALEFLNNDARGLWPKATNPQNPNGLDWNALYAADDIKDENRLDAQYLRANVDPTERYVLSLPETIHYRIKANESGFDRLILAGTWTNLGFNIACIEAAVISGMQAARVLTGEPAHIVGENYKELL